MTTLKHLWRSFAIRSRWPVARQPRADHAHRYRHLTNPLGLPRHVQRRQAEERLLAMACRRPL